MPRTLHGSLARQGGEELGPEESESWLGGSYMQEAGACLGGKGSEGCSRTGLRAGEGATLSMVGWSPPGGRCLWRRAPAQDIRTWVSVCTPVSLEGPSYVGFGCLAGHGGVGGGGRTGQQP